MEQQIHRADERTKSKQKQNQATSYSNRPRVLLFDLATNNAVVSLKDGFTGRFLVNNVAQHDVWSWCKSSFL